MMNMNYTIIIIFIATIILFGVLRISDTESTTNKAKTFFCSYSIIVCLLLCSVIIYYIGLKESGSPLLSADKQRKIVQNGFYVEPDSAFVFSGAALANGFKQEPLKEDEYIYLKPIWDSTRSANFWELKSNSNQLPLRLDDTCANIPDNCWFNTYDTLFVNYKENNHVKFFAIDWDIYSKPFLTIFKKNYLYYYYYSQGIVDGEKRIYNPKITHVPLANSGLLEGRYLSTMVNLSNNEFKNKIKTFSPEIWKIFKSILWVRRVKNNTASQMGIIIDDSLFQNSDIRFYKNGSQLRDINSNVQRIINYNTFIDYGIGYEKSLQLKLTKTTRIDSTLEKLGQLVEIYYRDPKSWILPPNTKSFLFTSSEDYVPLNGYEFNIGRNQHQFYAKASLNNNYDTLVINDGKNKASITPFELIHIGDNQQGVTLTLVKIHAAINYTGLWSILILIFLTGLFNTILFKDKYTRLKIDFAWTVIWGIVLTILVIRLILAYRVSLLPPLNATQLEIKNVFDKSLIYSFGALVAIPIMLLICKWICIKELKFSPNFKFKKVKQKIKQISKYLLRNNLLVIGLLIYLLIILEYLMGSNESIKIFGIPIRINLFTYSSIILGICIIVTFRARNNLFLKNSKEKKWFFICFVGAVMLVSFVIGDRGFIINLVSILFFIVFLFLWNEYNNHKLLIFFWPIVLVFAIVLFPLILNHIPWLSESIFNPNGTVSYRLKNYSNTVEPYLLSKSDDNRLNIDLLLRNSQQNWQMMNYDAEGIYNTYGYCNSPISNVGMTYPTTLSDCVFSINILPEHGKFTGFLVIICYLLLGGLIFYASGFLPTQYQYRSLILFTIGIFYIYNTLVMVSANLGLVVFTGQNIPLLSLNSGTDIFQNAVFLMIVTFLLYRNISTSKDNHYLNENKLVKKVIIIFLVLSIGWSIYIFYEMSNFDKNYLDNLNFSDNVYTRLLNDLPAEGRNSPLELVNDSIKIKGYSNLNKIEKLYIDQFNSRLNKYDPNGGLYYLTDELPQKKILINRNYFKLNSPFKEKVMWDGIILARGIHPEPKISAFGSSFSFSLDSSGYPQAIMLDVKPTALDTKKHVVIMNSNKEILCDFKRKGSSLIIIPRERNCIYVEGELLGANSQKELNVNDLIVIEDGKFRRNLIYLGSQQHILSFVQWRNGEIVRKYPEQNNFPLAYTLGKFEDVQKNISKVPITDTLKLSIDIALNNNLQKLIEDYAKKDSIYRDNDPLLTDRLALSVIDAFTGEILALPEWPSINPSSPQFEKLLLQASYWGEQRLLKNYNMMNHVIGSTIKPLTFASLASELWPGIKINNLIVINKSDKVELSNSHYKHPHTVIGGIKLGGVWDCNSISPQINSQDFLINSNDYYEVMIGMIGLIPDEKDFFKVLVPSKTNYNVVYNNKNYNLNMMNLPDGIFTELEPQKTTSNIDDGILFSGYKKLFDASLLDTTSKIFENEVHYLLNSSSNSTDIIKNDYLNEILPDPVNFFPRLIKNPYPDLTSFFLGGGECRWNNVKMTEAAARLATGLKIRAHLEEMPINLIVEPENLPMPLGNKDWRIQNIINPLEKVGISGTAEKLKTLVSSPYKIICKTGTLNEKSNNRESEMLLFVIGRWDKDKFVKGKTLACYLYMQDSKDKNENMKKFDFAKPIIKEILNYIKNKN